MATRSRKEEIRYQRHLKTVDRAKCVFCAIDEKDEQFLRETPSFKVIRNIFAYSLWDGQKVVDHIMVVPKKHTDSIAKVAAHEAHELIKLIGEYEKKGYNIYARAPASAIKSVVHQHTHLIKTAGAAKRFLLHFRWPFYFRLSAD